MNCLIDKSFSTRKNRESYKCKRPNKPADLYRSKTFFASTGSVTTLIYLAVSSTKNLFSLLFTTAYQKALIGISFGCVFVAVISLLLTQLIDTEASFYKINLSKRIVDYLLITDILTGM